MEGKIVPSNGAFFYPKFTYCVHAKNDAGHKVVCVKTLKCSSGNVDCSFDTSDKNFRRNSENFLLKVQK